MKNIRQFMKKDAYDTRMEMTNHRATVPTSKLSSGSIIDKFPVILDGGKTIIFIADKSKEKETRLRYALRFP